MSDLIQGVCPFCGNALQLPEGAEECSCLFCGKHFRLGAMTAQDTADEPKYMEEREYLRKNLIRTIVNYPDYYKKLTKKEFFAAFEAYETDNAELLGHLDTCAAAAPEGKAECIKKVCSDLLNEFKAHCKSGPRWVKKSGQDEIFFNVRVVLSIFLTPLVKKCKLETATLFCDELHSQWRAAYPSQKWTPGDYEVLEESYGKSSRCFITTATCLHEGKGDRCEELQAFRAFRDGYLRENGGQADIELYYDIAPAIVSCIEHLSEAEQVYGEIRQKWLDPCYFALLENRPSDCRKIYTDMVTTLQAKYLQ